jgi:hypothetical protein
MVYSMDTTQSNYSKQVLINSDYGNDESRSCMLRLCLVKSNRTLDSYL